MGLFFLKYSRIPRDFPSCQPKANLQNHRVLHCIVWQHGAKVITVISFAMWKILYTTLNKVSISLADSFYYQFPKLGSPFIWENPHCCDRSFIPLDSFCLEKRWPNIFYKGPDSNYFRLCSLYNIANTQLCHCSSKAAIDYMLKRRV